MTAKREPVILTMSILAGLQLFFGGLAAVTLLQGNTSVALIAACGTLAVSAAQGGIQFYVRGQVTPVEDATPAPENLGVADPGTDVPLGPDGPAAESVPVDA